METVTLNLSQDEQKALKNRSTELGLPPEELVRRGLRSVLSPLKLSFKDALEYTLQKNAELYRRLA